MNSSNHDNDDSSSQPRVGFDFSVWRATYREAYGRQPDVSDAWLTWFVGFCEGECSFTVAKRGDRSFIVSQGLRNLRVLLTFRDVLRFGRVVWQNRPHSVRYAVQDRVGLALIAALFDGNIVLAKRRDDLRRWADPRYVCRSLVRCDRNPVPSLHDGWLSGFSDGEACYHARLRSRGYRFEYSLSQGGRGARPVLMHLMRLLDGGRVTPHSQPGAYSWIVADLVTCGRLSAYIRRWPHVSTKATSYARWDRLRRRLVRGDHLDRASRPALRALALSINAHSVDAAELANDLARMDSAVRPSPGAARGLRPATRSNVDQHARARGRRSPRASHAERHPRPAVRRRS